MFRTYKTYGIFGYNKNLSQSPISGSYVSDSEFSKTLCHNRKNTRFRKSIFFTLSFLYNFIPLLSNPLSCNSFHFRKSPCFLTFSGFAEIPYHLSRIPLLSALLKMSNFILSCFRLFLIFSI